jgi:hypothetical protein
MKKITILLSSVLTLLLITSNNASYAFAIVQPVFAEQPNKNVFKGQLRKGNVFKGNVRMLPNRNSGGGRFDPISTKSRPWWVKPNPVRKAGFVIGPVGKDGFLEGQEGEAFSGDIWCIDGECKDKDHKYIGENGKVGLSVGPIGKDGFTKDIYYFTDGGSNTVSPKGVPLKFIEGEWVEPLANVDLQNITEGNSEPFANVAE